MSNDRAAGYNVSDARRRHAPNLRAMPGGACEDFIRAHGFKQAFPIIGRLISYPHTPRMSVFPVSRSTSDTG